MTDRKELINVETKNGAFGKVTINTYLTEPFYDIKTGGKKVTILQEINRIEEIEEDSFVLEMAIYSALDNSIEEIYFDQKASLFPNNPLDCEIKLDFIKRCDKQNIDRYFLQGTIGEYAFYDFYIMTLDTYAKARAIIIELCNPDRQYKINDFIDLFRKNANPQIAEKMANLDQFYQKR